ncbi:MAG TPA: hypothetical protein VGL27_02825 [Negativicutes bacterium]
MIIMHDQPMPVSSCRQTTDNKGESQTSLDEFDAAGFLSIDANCFEQRERNGNKDE